MKLFLIILIFLFTSSLLAEEIPKIQCTLDEVQDVINGKYYKSNDTFLFDISITDEKIFSGGEEKNLVKGKVKGPLFCGDGKFNNDSSASDERYFLWCGTHAGEKYYWYHFQIWRYTETFLMLHHIDDITQTMSWGKCKKAEQKL